LILYAQLASGTSNREPFTFVYSIENFYSR